MATASLEVQIAELDAERITPEDEAEVDKFGKRLTRKDIAVILQMRNVGAHPYQIAAALGFTRRTIKQVLHDWSDTREIARKYLESQAEKLAATVANTDDAAVALKALGKLDVVREDRESAGTGVIIQVGAPGHPLSLPDLSPIGMLSPSENAERKRNNE